ncbi:MAG: methionine--tRNA ligase [Alphaproteobacteria bacterium]|nr:methionine--tRNA ligase [Alphaproteobacteria bacterium]
MKFCVTTPIYYINGTPHIGHAYASTAADVLARFNRLDGKCVHFSTGTDEHGIKVARSAENANMDVNFFSDMMSAKFKQMSELMNISYDDFIRTTEARHICAAQKLWSLIEKDIYKSSYTGWYDPRDEVFVAESEIVNGIAPSGGKVEWMEEESYFFKLSDYQDKLLEHYETHPDFIAPTSRRNEIINFVKSGLKDLCISRSKFNWGVPVPNEEGHVMYVWIDALANYLTTFGFPANQVEAENKMANCIHIVGKEILRFHAVYWPAFLMSAGIKLPKRIFAHGWWTCEGQKMSKSVGNVVDPFEIVSKYGVDSLRYFMMREVRFGEDGDFSEDALKKRITYDLANDLGNLVQRVLAFIQKRNGQLHIDYNFSEEYMSLFNNSRNLISRIRELISKQDLSNALNVIWDLVSESNKFVNDIKPWELAKSNDPRLNSVLTVLCESIRAIAFGLASFMPETSTKIFRFMNIRGKSFKEIDDKFIDQIFPQPFPLFPKEK